MTEANSKGVRSWNENRFRKVMAAPVKNPIIDYTEPGDPMEAQRKEQQKMTRGAENDFLGSTGEGAQTVLPKADVAAEIAASKRKNLEPPVEFFSGKRR